MSDLQSKLTGVKFDKLNKLLPQFELEFDLARGMEQLHRKMRDHGFDRSAFEARLRELKARVLPSADEPDVVRFTDDNGIILEVKAAS